MTAPEMQQLLDTTGVLDIPAGDYNLDVPLFIDQSDCGKGVRVRGVDPWRTRLFCGGFGSAGGAFVNGFRRGSKLTAGSNTITPLLTPDHFQTDGTYRTKGDSYLTASKSVWDLGPLGPALDAHYGWGTVDKLSIRFSAYRNSGTSWAYATLCGINRDGDGRLPYGPAPEPFVLYWDNTVLTLAIRTSDLVLRVFRIAADHTNPDINLFVSVDLTAGTVTALTGGGQFTSNGTPVAVTTDEAGAGWGPGLKFCENQGIPFCVGFAMSNWGGFWNRPLPDFTLRALELWDRSNYFTYADTFNQCPVTTYPGGPRPPLLKCYGRNGSSYLLAAYRGPDINGGFSNASDTVIQNVCVYGHYTGPVVALGHFQGGLTIQNCFLNKGAAAIAHMRFGEGYTINILNCGFGEQTDTGISLRQTNGLKIDSCSFAFQQNSIIQMWECNGSVKNCYASPSPLCQQYGVFQWGGSMLYEKVNADYERRDEDMARMEAWIVIEPGAEGLLNRPTDYKVVSCVHTDSPSPALVRVKQRPNSPLWNYSGVTTGRVWPDVNWVH